MTRSETKPGLFARQRIAALLKTGAVAAAAPVEPTQLQPASLDLRLDAEAFRVRASFLPGRGSSVAGRLKSLNPERVSLAGDGAVLEKALDKPTSSEIEVLLSARMEALDEPFVCRC